MKYCVLALWTARRMDVSCLLVTRCLAIVELHASKYVDSTEPAVDSMAAARPLCAGMAWKQRARPKRKDRQGLSNHVELPKRPSVLLKMLRLRATARYISTMSCALRRERNRSEKVQKDINNERRFVLTRADKLSQFGCDATETNELGRVHLN